MTTGILYLIPNTLDNNQTKADLPSIIPDEVLKISAILDYFIAESKKTARTHLKRVAEIHPLQHPLQQIDIAELNVRTEETLLPALLEPILAGRNAGLISEKGVPAVADPGAELVRIAQEKSILVRPLVGPSSLLLSLMASGLNGQNFAFNGYLPIDNDQRSKRIRVLEERSRKDHQTQLFIETPYRNTSLFSALCQHCRPDTRLCIATNVSLQDESIETLPIATWRERLKRGKQPDFQRKPTVFLFLAG